MGMQNSKVSTADEINGRDSMPHGYVRICRNRVLVSLFCIFQPWMNAQLK